MSSTTTTVTKQRQEGTIAEAFASLSGQKFAPLESRFKTIKEGLINGHEAEIKASWDSLLDRLREETAVVAKAGSSIVPTIDFKDIASPADAFTEQYRKRGVAVIRNVIDRSEARNYKYKLEAYIAANPQTKVFPPDKPAVYELYWSPSQIAARSHPNLLATQRHLLSFWHSKDPQAPILTEPTIYADRLRIRQPGDAQFALGPHIDAGCTERWEPDGYGRGKVYDAIWSGNWEAYDPWESSCRLTAESNLYDGAGSCTHFRMAQGWLSMSETGPGEGTLLVNPLLGLATAYVLLRPFFTPIQAPAGMLEGHGTAEQLSDPAFLDKSNWVLESPMSSWLHGATVGKASQEVVPYLHPHLRLDQTMVHVPKVQPGDYVVWHCDCIHAVDSVHKGTTDSSVMYIPASPLTERNAASVQRQRDAFLQGIPSPDMPGGIGETNHVGKPTKDDFAKASQDDGMRAFGMARWDVESQGLTEGERQVMQRANEILGFT